MSKSFKVSGGKYSKLDDFNYYYGVLFELLNLGNPTFNDRVATGIRASKRFSDEEVEQTNKILDSYNVPHKWLSQNRLVIETSKIIYE